MFHFSTYRPSSFKHLSHLSTSFWMPNANNDAGCCPSHWRTTDCTSVSDANFCPFRILFIGPKKRAVTGAKSNCRAGVVSLFAHKKQLTACCSLWDNFSGNVAIRAVPRSRNPAFFSKSGRNPAPSKIPLELDTFAGFGKIHRSKAISIIFCSKIHGVSHDSKFF